MPTLVVTTPPDQLRPEILAGRATVAATGLAQPVFPVPRQVVARIEERQPEAGRVWAGKPGPNRLAPRPAVVVPAQVQAPAPGAVVVGKVGFGVGRRPARPLQIATEDRPPEPGRGFAAKPPPPNLSPQQPAGTVRVVATEERHPEPGRLLSRTFGHRPSHRVVVRPLIARVEELQPAPGVVRSGKLLFESPATPRAIVARAEERLPEPGTLARMVRAVSAAPSPAKAVRAAAEMPLPWAGLVLGRRGGPVPAALTPQQLAGRVLLAWVEGLRPEEGRTTTLFGRPRAGAIPPVIT